MTPGSPPVRSPPAADEQLTEVAVHGVVLAAGTSSRYGAENKLLQRVDGEPIVRRAARTLLEAGVEEVVAVVGHEADAVREALDGLDVRLRENEAYEAGQSTSVREGVRDAADWDADAVLIALGDMPFVAPASVTALLRAYEAWDASALAAAYEGQRGNPVLFDARHFDALADVDGDVGGRDILLTADDAALVETGDPGVRRDVDEPSDLPDGDGS